MYSLGRITEILSFVIHFRLVNLLNTCSLVLLKTHHDLHGDLSKTMCSGILSSFPALVMLSHSPAPLPLLTGWNRAGTHVGQRQHIPNSARLDPVTAPVTHAVRPTWDNAWNPRSLRPPQLGIENGATRRRIG